MKLPTLTLPQDNKAQSNIVFTTIMLLAVLFISITSGVLAAYENLYLIIALLAIYGALFILIVPPIWTVWLIFWAAFLITGPSAYLIRFTQIQWLTVLISAALILPVIFNLLRSRTNVLSTQFSANLFLPLSFISLAIFSSIINQSQLGDIINASRHYFFMWPLMLIFGFGLIQSEHFFETMESSFDSGFLTTAYGTVSVFLCCQERCPDVALGRSHWNFSRKY